MTERIASLSERQKFVIRHTLDLLIILFVLVGLYLASGIYTRVPVPTHSPMTVSDTVDV